MLQIELVLQLYGPNQIQSQLYQRRAGRQYLKVNAAQIKAIAGSQQVLCRVIPNAADDNCSILRFIWTFSFAHR